MYFSLQMESQNRLYHNRIFISRYYNKNIFQGQYKSVSFLMAISLKE